MLDRLRAFIGCQNGMAMTEFALGLPVFLTLTIGGIESSNLALAHMRVSNLAMTVADNAGRVMSGIDESDVYEVFSGAQVVGESIGFEEHGRVILSSLEDNGRKGSKHGQVIRWQRCWGDLDVDPAYGTQGAGANDFKSGIRAGQQRPENRRDIRNRADVRRGDI